MMIKNWLKRFVAWGTALRNKIWGGDVIVAARWKITFAYALVGLAILLIGGYLVYTYLISTIQHTISIIQESISSPAAIGEQSTSDAIRHSLNADFVKMSVAVGFFIIFTLILSAYILAEVVLWPIRRAMDRQKRFISDVSHELRTPLSVMKMNSEVVLLKRPSGEPTPTELKEAIASNLEEVNRMSKITQFLLTFASPERWRENFELTPVDLREITESVFRLMDPIAREKGVALSCAVKHEPGGEESMMALGNATALDEMVTNLIKNAVSYTTSGGAVHVLLTRDGRRHGDSVTVSVRDTGVGISPEDLPNIFRPFYRSKDSEHKPHATNAGLGLAIVKEIAELHEASLSIESQLKQGTTISVRFPSFSRKLHF